MAKTNLLLIVACLLTTTVWCDSTINQIVSLLQQSMQNQYQSGNPWLRQAHAKQHGCVRGFMQPDANLPAELAQGIFTNQTIYPVFIRFSNGVGPGFTAIQSANESDYIPDIRGFGIKVLNVSGDFIVPYATSQVFTLTTGTVGFLPDEPSALSFFTAIQGGKFDQVKWLAENPRLAILYAAQATFISDLLSANWYQSVAQMHGQTPVKHHLYPCSASAQFTRNQTPRLDFNLLRDQLLADLSNNGSGCFRWAVQFYQDESSTPINDSTIQWNTPFQDLATLYIPSQVFGNDTQEDTCTWLSFNPALSLGEHQPVGILQDIRMAVYAAMATQRHSLQNQPNVDATYEDWVNYGPPLQMPA